MNRIVTRSLAASVSLSLVLACPGLAPYAAAQSIGRSAAAAPVTGVAPVVPGTLGIQSGTIPSLTPSALSLTPSFGAPSAPSITAVAPAASAKALAPSNVLSAASVPTALTTEGRRAPQALTKTVSAAAKSVSEILEKAGPVAQAAPGAASAAGAKLEDALTGAPALRRSAEELSAPSDSPWGDLPSDRHQLARPAGESISQAAAAQDSNVPPTPPAGQSPAPQSPQGPFWPRLLSAGLALVPAIVLGLPLLSASAYLIGGLVVATSLSLAVMPFLNENSPSFLKSAPGFGLAALGLSALGIVVSLSLGLGVATSPALGWIGALALLGGWGLSRYGLGRGEVKRWGRYGSVETLSAFFGGLAGVTAVALAASTAPLGLAATISLWVAAPLTALLWFHLPGWVGRGLGAALEGVWFAGLGLSRVLTAIHRDTVLLDRLNAFSRRHWAASKWNGVWLAVMWTPLVLAEAAMYVLSALGGLAIGAVAAPVNFLWGATQKLWPKSKANVYFAEAARFVFDNVQNGKVARFNKLEAKLIPYANSPKLASRALGSLGIRAAQLGWLAYSLIAAPLLSVGGLFAAFGRLGAYDDNRHDVDYLKIERRDSPSEKPDEPNEPEPTTPAKAPLAPKLLAAALALVPAYFFGLPILAGHSLIQIGLYGALVLPLAAMPFMGKAPMWAKSLAGKAMFYNGLVFLLNGNAILVGLIALLGGWGFQRWVKKTAEKEGSFDEANLGAYFGALGSAAAIGAVWVGYFGGLIGWGTLGLAAVTSIFLVMHLPEWTFEGVRGAAKQVGKSVESYDEALTSWKGDTEYWRNLRAHASYWLEKTYWNGVWLSVIWVPAGVILAAQHVLSLALGVVTGLFRAPFGFAAAALQEAKPHTRKAIFAKGLVDAWRGLTEGSKGFYDKLTKGTKAWMADKAPVSGRPTFKATLGLLGHELLTALWLLGTLLLNVSGAALLWGAISGARAAFAPTRDYMVSIPLYLDGPVGDKTMEEKGLPALKQYFDGLKGDLDRSKIAYDKDALDPEKITNRGFYTSAEGAVEVFAHVTLNASQASAARRWGARLTP